MISVSDGTLSLSALAMQAFGRNAKKSLAKTKPQNKRFRNFVKKFKMEI